jgi:predicted Mrr-cat superfamily restriction endonuclease
LLEPDLSWEKFREIVRRAYYLEEATLRKAGAAAGHMWRFIRDMRRGDLVVAPWGREFFVAEIAGPPHTTLRKSARAPHTEGQCDG